MSHTRVIRTLGTHVAWILLLAGAATSHAQVQALPASTVLPPQRLAQFSSPAMADTTIPGNMPALGPPYVAADPALTFGPMPQFETEWSWQLLPSGLMYRSYLAGYKEPRITSRWVQSKELGWLWETALGGRAGLLRFGSDDDGWPEGWQIDLEGAVFPRLDWDYNRDILSTDFQFGVPLTFRRGSWEAKLAYSHTCSHLVDEYFDRWPGTPRKNYVKNSIIAGLGYRPVSSIRLYTEVGYAVDFDGGAKPWELQFGVEYSPLEPSGLRGAPFVALNAHLREEVDFGGAFTAEAGWQWRGRNGQLFRVGAHYFNGMSEQYQFYNQFEQLVGFGFWYDF